MKEILYIQAGSFANYIGSHFWNTQESYFTYGQEESDVDHDVSFREGMTLNGESTFCPRLLLFDRKAKFGDVSATRGLYGDEEVETDETEAPLWGGAVAEYRHARISPSAYHKRLDAEAAEGAAQEPKTKAQGVEESDVRFWSDYSRVYLHPRSIQKLPDRAEWEDAEGDWSWSREAFTKYDADTALMEEAFRPFVEECDTLQGVQVMHDTATFGGFTDSFLTVFRDEFPKLPRLAFPLLSVSAPWSFDIEDELSFRRAINDALCLRGLDSLATIIVPVQSPSTWTTGEWLEGISLNRASLYHTSAIVSTQIESSTLPFRLKGSLDDLTSVCERLSWNASTHFAHLSGAFPLSSTLNVARDFERRVYDLSASPANAAAHKYGSADFAQIYVARDFSSTERRQFDQWAEQRKPVPYSIYAPAYPIPSSFPLFFDPPLPSPPPPMHVLSALSSTARTARLFAGHATLVAEGAVRHADVLVGMGLETDEVRELMDALWVLCDACAGAEEHEDMGMGEDEE